MVVAFLKNGLFARGCRA